MTEAAPARRRDRSRLPGPERRRQILAVTGGLVAERGFWGMSVRDVADGCGLTVPGVLRHFGSKAELLIAVLEDHDARDVRALTARPGRTAAGPGSGSGGEPAQAEVRGALREWCSAVMRRSAAQPEIVRLYALLQAESLDPAHPAHAFFLARQERTLARLALLAAPHTGRPESLARRTLAMMDGLRVRWLRDPAAIDLVREWEAAADTVFGPVPLGAPAAAGGRPGH